MEALNANLFKFKIPSDNEASGSESEYSEEEVNFLADLPTEVVHRVHALENLHDKRVDLELQFKKELAALEQKYEALYAPLYADRARIVKGEREVTEEEYAGREQSGVSLVEESKTESSVKGIPEFWFSVLKRSQLEEMIFETDEPVLKHLSDVTSARVIEEDTPKLTLSFHFSPNEYFTNSVVSVTVIFNPEGNGVVALEGTPINWKEGKDLCFKQVVQKMRHRSKPGVFTTKETRQELNSFFHLFDDVKGCDHDEEDEDEHDHDHGEMETKMMANAEIISFLDRYIIPNAVEFFLGRAAEHEGEEEYDFDDDEDDEEYYESE